MIAFFKPSGSLISATILSLMQTLGVATAAYSAQTITVADAPLTLAYYSDGSCLLTVDSLVQSGKTVIDADVDDVGSRMLLHCDTDDGRRLTLLARGDSLNVAQRVDLLTREEIVEGKFGMIAWLTRSGAHYKDDTAPRRYVIAGSVKLSKTPAVDVQRAAPHSQGQAFATVNGLLEPIVKADDGPIQALPTPDNETSTAPSEIPSETVKSGTQQATQ